jgi:hypothetical protein
MSPMTDNDKNSAAVAAITTEFLLQAPRLTNHNFDVPLDDDQIHAVDEFEMAWYQFLLRNPTVLPPSTKLKRSLVDFPNKIEQTQITMKQVEMELQRQLDFFNTSMSQLESNYAEAMTSTAKLQQEIQGSLNKEIDCVANADQLLGQELPWDFYFDNLDQLADQAHLGRIQNDIHQGKGPFHAAFARTMMMMSGQDDEEKDDEDATAELPPLPSHRALYLAEIEDQTELAQAALTENSSRILKKAYVIDNALLEAEVEMKQKQCLRLEQTISSQKSLSKFLTEHNIWGLLPKDTNNAPAATAAASKKTSTVTASQK